MYGEIKHLTLRKSHRNTFPPFTIILGITLPTLMFAVNYWLMGFSIRHYRPALALLLGPAVTVAACLFYSAQTYRRLKNNSPARGLVAITVTMWSAMLSATYLSDICYWSFANSYYSYQDLLSYPNIDPNLDRGQSYMDSGITYFKESTYVAVTKAVAFRSTAVYCAAPIVRQPIENQDGTVAVETEGTVVLPTSGTIDWWAVGINCCDPSGNGFTCGEVGNPLARAGVRMLREDARPFFLMAVQEWNSQYGLPSKHPLFFHWVQDPLVQIDGYLINAKQAFFSGIGIFFAYTTAATFIIMYVLALYSVP